MNEEIYHRAPLWRFAAPAGAAEAALLHQPQSHNTVPPVDEAHSKPRTKSASLKRLLRK